MVAINIAGDSSLKDKEIQHFKVKELLTVFFLSLVTLVSYVSLSIPIFISETISVDQMKAEVLAYQAAQIFLLKDVEKQPVPSRSIASESDSFDGQIGEDSRGKPFRFTVTREGGRQLRVLLMKETEQPGEPPEAFFDLKIDIADATES